MYVSLVVRILPQGNQQLNAAAISALLQSSESLTSGDVSLLARALTSLMTSSNVNNEIVSRDGFSRRKMRECRFYWFSPLDSRYAAGQYRQHTYCEP